MKKADFLTKLKNEKKLKLVEPSENLSKSYLNKSESNLFSAKLLFEHKKFEEAVRYFL